MNHTMTLLSCARLLPAKPVLEVRGLKTWREDSEAARRCRRTPDAGKPAPGALKQDDDFQKKIAKLKTNIYTILCT